jgi:hypothetical protein
MLPLSHDFISLRINKLRQYDSKVVRLYKMGLSLREIESQEGLPKTTIRSMLIRSKVPLRPMREEVARVSKGNRGKKNWKPPFGFCYFEGRITRHPKEYPILLTIIRRWKSGQSANSIAKWLNGQGIASPMNCSWSWNSVTNIIQRIKTGKLIQKGERYELR